jgi:hypothetical protein
MNDFAVPQVIASKCRAAPPAPHKEVGYGRVAPDGAVVLPNLKYGSTAREMN